MVPSGSMPSGCCVCAIVERLPEPPPLATAAFPRAVRVSDATWGALIAVQVCEREGTGAVRASLCPSHATAFAVIVATDRPPAAQS